MDETGLNEWEQHQTQAAAAVRRATGIMARLRGPGGCPWDREQTFDSIRKHTLEETYEVFDAIERRDWNDLRDELGDLLLQVLFYAQMAAEAGYFTLAEVADSLSAKLERRHPHIFGDAVAEDASTVVRNWEAIKAQEKSTRDGGVQPASMLDAISRAMPAGMEAAKLGSKAAKVGFDWPDAAGLFEKMREELDELAAEVEAGDAEATEAEFGDLLFTAANLARHLHVDSESALRGSNAKFRRRFAAMEQAAGGVDAFAALDLTAKEALWSAAKARERDASAGERSAS